MICEGRAVGMDGGGAVRDTSFEGAHVRTEEKFCTGVEGETADEVLQNHRGFIFHTLRMIMDHMYLNINRTPLGEAFPCQL